MKIPGTWKHIRTSSIWGIEYQLYVTPTIGMDMLRSRFVNVYIPSFQLIRNIGALSIGTLEASPALSFAIPMLEEQISKLISYLGLP